MRRLEVSYPWGTANLKMVERPDPQAGHEEVIVRMRAVSVNFRDTLMAAQGGYVPGGENAPRVVPFSDGCGIVEAVGDGVTRVAVGDRVSTVFCPNWISGPPSPEKTAGSLGSSGADGVGCELALLPERAVSLVPDFLTDHEVATLPCAALAAWRAMFVDARLQPGDTVVLQGTGGVSIFGLQFARAAGYCTIITSSSDQKLARARELGATHLINYRATPQWHSAVQAATHMRGADFIMEVGGAGTLIESLKSVRMGGHIAVIGLLTGTAPATLPIPLVMAKSVTMQGTSSVGSREMFEAMCRAIAVHQIHPVIDRVMPWTDAARAIDEIATGNHFGKIVLAFD
jgi:NADPH:quinone reductase-like Zn-dependent oxidoreductase